jgi:hypothetical protein
MSKLNDRLFNHSRKAWSAIWMVFACSLLLHADRAIAGPNYIHGFISNVTFTDDEVMIMVNAGLPDNCAGTPWGWMRIPATSKTMAAFIIGLWLRGDAQSTNLTVYTDGLVSGYCRVTQIDPVN